MGIEFSIIKIIALKHELQRFVKKKNIYSFPFELFLKRKL